MRTAAWMLPKSWPCRERAQSIAAKGNNRHKGPKVRTSSMWSRNRKRANVTGEKEKPGRWGQRDWAGNTMSGALLEFSFHPWGDSKWGGTRWDLYLYFMETNGIHYFNEVIIFWRDPLGYGIKNKFWRVQKKGRQEEWEDYCSIPWERQWQPGPEC